MAFTIKLYKSNAEKERVNKTDFLKNEIELTGVLRDATSVISPTIRIEYDGNISQYNYAYIPEFGRYYYIDNIISVQNKLWEINMSCDVLMTYKSDIYLQKAIINKSEKEFNKMYNDGSYGNTVEEVIYTAEFDQTPLFGSGYRALLTCF